LWLFYSNEKEKKRENGCSKTKTEKSQTKPLPSLAYQHATLCLYHPLLLPVLIRPAMEIITSQKNDFCWLDELPNEIVQLLMLQLGDYELCSLTQTCKRMASLSSDHLLWKSKCFSRFAAQMPKQQVDYEGKWKEMYQERYLEWLLGASLEEISKKRLENVFFIRTTTGFSVSLKKEKKLAKDLQSKLLNILKNPHQMVTSFQFGEDGRFITVSAEPKLCCFQKGTKSAVAMEFDQWVLLGFGEGSLPQTLTELEAIKTSMSRK
jgi:hypothetical protein